MNPTLVRGVVYPAYRKVKRDKVRQACGDKTKVVFDLRKEINLTPSGKHRYVISNVARHHEAAPKT